MCVERVKDPEERILDPRTHFLHLGPVLHSLPRKQNTEASVWTVELVGGSSP